MRHGRRKQRERLLSMSQVRGVKVSDRSLRPVWTHGDGKLAAGTEIESVDNKMFSVQKNGSWKRIPLPTVDNSCEFNKVDPSVAVEAIR